MNKEKFDKNKVLTLGDCLFIKNGWVSMPLEIAEHIADEAVNKGYIHVWQHLELNKEVFGNWVDDTCGGNAGQIQVIDAFDFLERMAKFSKEKTWGKCENQVVKSKNGDIKAIL